MKAFITGATGFIGTRVAERMARAGHGMRCLVRPASDATRIEGLGAEVVRGDVVDREVVLRGMEGCDHVIHLAAAYEFWLPDPAVFRKVNVTGTRNVMECALEAGVRKVTHVSSLVVYGTPADDPVTESSDFGSRRWSEYARTKFEGDRIAWDLHERGLPLVVLYPGAVLGPGDPKATGRYIDRLVHHRMPATVFDSAIFPWVHVDDVAEAVVRATEMPGNSGERYIVSAESLTFGEINHMVSEISGEPLPRPHLPDRLAILMAGGLTRLADLVKKPPPWGMSTDQMQTMGHGPRADGHKAERDLGFTYTSIRTALEQEVAFAGD
jgi:dihydroflavonol-4-reductase